MANIRKEQKKEILRQIQEKMESIDSNKNDEYTYEALLEYAVSQVGEDKLKNKKISPRVLFALKENLISGSELLNIIKTSAISKIGNIGVTSIAYAGTLALIIEALVLGAPAILLALAPLYFLDGYLTHFTIKDIKNFKSFDNKLGCTLLKKIQDGDDEILKKLANNTTASASRTEIEKKLNQINSNESGKIIGQIEKQLEEASPSTNVEIDADVTINNSQNNPDNSSTKIKK